MGNPGQSAPLPPADDDVQLLIAALNHAWSWYDARISRGLQVVNYYLVSVAILATGYVNAINAKLFGVAALLSVSGIVLTGVSFVAGLRQRHLASAGELALAELQGRVAARLGVDSFRMIRPRGALRYVTPSITFGFAVVVSASSAVWALTR